VVTPVVAVLITVPGMLIAVAGAVPGLVVRFMPGLVMRCRPCRRRRMARSAGPIGRGWCRG
jgi:hypothetical protein